MPTIKKITKLSKEKQNEILGNERSSEKYGFMFVIPNQARKVSDYDSKRAEALANLYGCGMTESLVQIWTHNQDQDNWSDHHYPYDLDFDTGLKKDLFPNVFPKAFFEGEQEGNLITLDMEDTDGNHHYQTCCLRQRGYRYESFGDFEEVLEKI